VAASLRHHRAFFRFAGSGRMRRLRRIWKRAIGARGGAWREQEFAAELESHIQMQTEDNLRLGMSPGEARRAAVLKLGGFASTQESLRDQMGLPALDSLFKDIHYALRGMRKSPGFTVVMVLTLALGIGANTAIFSLVNQILLHPRGISHPERLVVVRTKYERLNLKSIPDSPPTFADARDSREVFEHAAAMRGMDVNYAVDSVPQSLHGEAVSAEWFDVFGARPSLGRVFAPEEDQPNANHVVVLAHSAWVRIFGADPSVVGRTVEFNQEHYRIIGVMGPGFEWPAPVDVWVPLALPQRAFNPGNRFNENLTVVARRKPDVPFAQANAWLKVLADRVLNAGTPGASFGRNSNWGLFGVPFIDFSAGATKTPVLILLGAVGLVLLIACSNSAGLMLARTSARAQEMAVRAALGASRQRLIQQTLAESLLLAIAGALVGLALAYGATVLLLRLAPQDTVTGLDASLDTYVLLLTAAAAIVSGIASGIAPAWQLARIDANHTLKGGGRSSTAGPARQRLRSTLVIAEAALALMLLVGAGLLLRTFAQLENVNPGFNPRGVTTAVLSLPRKQYPDGVKQAVFYRGVLERLTNTKGVKDAAIGLGIPFSPYGDSGGFAIEGRAPAPGEAVPHSDRRYVTPGYFAALTIPLKRGRVFTEEDRLETEPVVVIDEDLARQYWPDEDPIGKRIQPSSGEGWFTIVGITAHVLGSDLAADSGKGVVYFNLFQEKQALPVAWIMAKTSGDPAGMAAAIREAVHAADPNQPVHDFKTLDDMVSNSLAPRRFVTRLLGFFAVTALFMAALGLYGVISYSVTLRTREIGIRMALGEEQRSVLLGVLSQGLRLTGIGVVIGLAGSLSINRLLASQLFQVNAFDPLIFASMAAALLIAALLASYLPARRAVRVDPLSALRSE
jgi:predicted permease